jgi:ATP adenylyltransferase/5',5'''-P-1,P-4-tetraphosphate phosphorylase II
MTSDIFKCHLSLVSFPLIKDKSDLARLLQHVLTIRTAKMSEHFHFSQAVMTKLEKTTTVSSKGYLLCFKSILKNMHSF